MFCMVCGIEKDTLEFPTLAQLKDVVNKDYKGTVTDKRITKSVISYVESSGVTEEVVLDAEASTTDTTPSTKADFKIGGHELKICSNECWGDFRSMDFKIKGSSDINQTNSIVWEKTALRCPTCGKILGDTCGGHS